ncbi:MAG: hypothetical protein ACRDT0_14455 [Pseudonocardiaceae bacterium]
MGVVVRRRLAGAHRTCSFDRIRLEQAARATLCCRDRTFGQSRVAVKILRRSRLGRYDRLFGNGGRLGGHCEGDEWNRVTTRRSLGSI